MTPFINQNAILMWKSKQEQLYFRQQDIPILKWPGLNQHDTSEPNCGSKAYQSNLKMTRHNIVNKSCSIERQK